MAYAFSTANSRYLSTSSTPVTAVPLTLAAWFNFPSVGVNQSIVSINSVGEVNTNAFRLVLNGFNEVAAVTNAGSNASTPTPAITNGVWNHGCGVFTASNSRTSYANGIAAAVNTASFTPLALSMITIGANINGSAVAAQANGNIAEVGIWNAALSAMEIRSLARGTSPILIRPQSLVFYVPLVRNLVDLRDGRIITNNNGATIANHPRIYI